MSVFNFKKTGVSVAVFMALGLQGCSHFAEHKKVSQEVVTPIEMIDEVTEAYKKQEKKENDQYDVYQISVDDYDFDALFNVDGYRVTADIKATAKDALDHITNKMPSLSIVYNLENPNALNMPLNLNAHNLPLRKYLTLIEKTANLDIYFDDGVLYVNDFVILEGVISKLESGSKTHYSKIKGYLGNVLKSNGTKSSPLSFPSYPTQIATKTFNSVEKGGFLMTNPPISQQPVSSTPTQPSYTAPKPTIIIDEATGALHIKASPNSIRQSRSLIENYLNSSVSYANVELGIYRISNEKAKEVGVSVSKIIDNLYTLSAGSQASGIINKTLSFDREVTDNNGDILKTGLQMYEKNGLITSESSTILNVYNDVPTSMSDIQTTGYWIPGNLSENNTTINGASVVTYTEDKPEFVTEDVGKSLVFTPRINITDGVINMSIEYSDSKIYDTETFTWKRNLSIGDVIEIKKPLKSENKLSSTITLNNEGYSLFAGFKSKEGSIERQFVPGLGDTPVLSDIGANSTAGNKTDTLFVMKASFPSKRVYKHIRKKLIF